MKNTFNILLPFFAGFYETIFDSRVAYDPQMDIERYKDDFDVDITEDNIIFHEKEYEQAVAYRFWHEMENALKEMGIVKRFVSGAEIVSPQYYNYETDKIFCDAELVDDWQDKMRDFIAGNWNELQKDIAEDFACGGGFFPFISNDLDVWVNMLFNENDLQEKYVSCLLHYFLKYNENFDIERIEYNVIEAVCADEFAEIKLNDEQQKKVQ